MSVCVNAGILSEIIKLTGLRYWGILGAEIVLSFKCLVLSWD